MKSKSSYVTAEHLEAAADRLLRFNPEEHDPKDYVLVIARDLGLPCKRSAFKKSEFAAPAA